MKIGVIGCGKMATALINGILKTGLLKAESVIGVSRSQQSREVFSCATGASITNSITEAVEFADIVMIATKPGDAVLALAEAAKVKTDQHVLISVVAGLTIEKLSASFGGHQQVVRSMPNTPSLVGAGATGFCLSKGCGDEIREMAQSIFDSVGIAVEIPERLIDAVTGLSGSGPAYIYTIIEALADGGVKEGIPRKEALILAAQTVAGAAAMVKSTGEHPAVLRDQVTSPGGTTIVGVASLEASGLRSAMICAVSSAAQRAREIGS